MSMRIPGTSRSVPYRKGTVRRNAIVPGVTRRAGYYGRFKNPDAELKFIDTDINFTADTTGEIPADGVTLHEIAQGVAENERIGRKVVLKSIWLKGAAVYAPGGSASATAVTYLYIILDTQCNGASPGINDIFNTSALFLAFPNLENGDRFKVLKVMKFAWNPGAGVTTAYNGMSKNINWFRKCNIPIEFGGAVGDITEIKSNNVFIAAGCGTAGDDLVAFSMACRVRYSDLN